MGLYTDVIKERDKKDRALVKNANDRMMKRLRTAGSDEDPSGAFAALNYILSKFGLSSREVHGYSSVSEMLDLALDPLNVLYDEVDISEADWNTRTDYILAFAEDGRALVLMPGVTGYRYTDPASQDKGRVGKIKLKPVAYSIQRPIELREASIISIAMYVLRLVTQRDVLLIAGASLLVSALGLVTPKLNQYVLNEIVPMGTDGYSVLMRALILFITAGVIRGGISVAKSLSLAHMKIKIPSQVQSAVMSRVILMPQSFFMETSTGRLSKQLYNSRVLSEQILTFVMGASLTAVFSLVYIPQMASFSVVLLVPAISVLIIRCVFVIVAGQFFAENERKTQEAELDNRSFLFTALKGMQRIKESGAESRVYAGWTRRYQAVLACDLDQPAVLKVEDAVTTFLSSLTTVILLSLIIPNGIAKADYIAFNSSFALIVSAVTDLLDAQRKVFMMRPMIAQLKPILESDHEERGDSAVVRKLKGDIRIENVDFSYGSSSFGCLKDISLHIKPGEKVAFVGESGCGKSTLLKLILGSLKPVSGGLFIDNTPLDSLNLRSYRRQIGSVFQFSRVMPGTLYSNIAFCARHVSREEAEEAAKKADIHDTIMATPLGYDTEISDSNSGGFSGGQRQRLLIARALASKPGILILDEATSALDNISQSRVLRSVYEENCTVIMVAHRLSTVKDCDRIYLIKDGTIAEQGSFDDLIKMKGSFYELMRRQQAGSQRGE